MSCLLNINMTFRALRNGGGSGFLIKCWENAACFMWLFSLFFFFCFLAVTCLYQDRLWVLFQGSFLLRLRCKTKGFGIAFLVFLFLFFLCSAVFEHTVKFFCIYFIICHSGRMWPVSDSFQWTHWHMCSLKYFYGHILYEWAWYAMCVSEK